MGNPVTMHLTNEAFIPERYRHCEERDDERSRRRPSQIASLAKRCSRPRISDTQQSKLDDYN